MKANQDEYIEYEEYVDDDSQQAVCGVGASENSLSLVVNDDLHAEMEIYREQEQTNRAMIHSGASLLETGMSFFQERERAKIVRAVADVKVADALARSSSYVKALEKEYGSREKVYEILERQLDEATRRGDSAAAAEIMQHLANIVVDSPLDRIGRSVDQAHGGVRRPIIIHEEDFDFDD